MRPVLVVAHASRRQVVTLATRAIEQLRAAGFEVRMLPEEADDCGPPGVRVVHSDDAADGCELVVVLGGDGTFLRAAELARPVGVPMLGINLGHVGFLAAADPEELGEAVATAASGNYEVEERVTVDANIVCDGEVTHRAWALNEASLERTNRERMLEIAVEIDHRPLLRFGCDGLICATPTGSTAYAFSTGGPIVWPSVDALLLVPNAAHALFARPIVVAPTSSVEIDLVGAEHDAMLSMDGRRSLPVPAGAQVQVRRGELPVKVVRVGNRTFADRLVSKFQLPVRSLREAAAPEGDADDEPDAGKEATA